MLTILGFDLPLPPDLAFLGEPAFTFAINLLLWAVLAVLVYWVVIPIVKRFTRFMPGEVEDIIVGIIRRPITLLVFVIGARLSINCLALEEGG